MSPFHPLIAKWFLEQVGQDIEAFNPVICPLDVLAQEIVSMVGVETWNIDDLFEHLRGTYSYRYLSREQFDLVLNMLAGRYAASRVRELKPLISLDRLDNTVAARRGALQVLYFSGGVIPDRGYFHLRHQETTARIGELDEEFVWEASIGDTFALGTQNWQIQRITHNDVLVLPGNPRGAPAPFWKAEENGRDFHFSERLGQFLEEADARLDNPGFAATLQQVNHLDEAAAGELIDFLKRQKQATGCDVPHRHHLVVEFVSSGPGGAPGNQAIIHTMWGGRVNRPLAMALEAAWQARFGQRPELYVSNDCVIILLPHEIGGDELLSLVGSTKVESLLRSRLEGSGFFGARFRECAGRAIMNKFKPPDRIRSEARPLRHRVPRPRFAGTRETRFFAGNWHLLTSAELPDDLLETEERKKDRARLLLDRYGILFRELLQRELPPFRWAGVFRSLRIMELSGEVMAGIFFHGIPGPQFISHQAFRNLQHKLPEDAVYWMNATDPASLCGIQLDSIRGSLPPRVSGTHLVYRGTKLVFISRRNGRELTFNVPPDDPRLPEYMGVLRHLLTRQFQPVKRIAIETINDEKAPQSPYVDALRTSFDILIDYRNVNLYRKMG